MSLTLTQKSKRSKQKSQLASRATSEVPSFAATAAGTKAAASVRRVAKIFMSLNYAELYRVVQ
jgi:hypothetical protein